MAFFRAGLGVACSPLCPVAGRCILSGERRWGAEALGEGEKRYRLLLYPGRRPSLRLLSMAACSSPGELRPFLSHSYGYRYFIYLPQKIKNCQHIRDFRDVRDLDGRVHGKRQEILLCAEGEGGAGDGGGQVQAFGDLSPDLLVYHLHQTSLLSHQLIQHVQIQHLLGHDGDSIHRCTWRRQNGQEPLFKYSAWWITSNQLRKQSWLSVFRISLDSTWFKLYN